MANAGSDKDPDITNKKAGKDRRIEGGGEILLHFTLLPCLIAAFTKLTKSGCGKATVLLYSG